MACVIKPVTLNVNVFQSFSGILTQINDDLPAPRCEFGSKLMPSPVWPGLRTPTWEMNNLIGNIHMEGAKTLIMGTVTPFTDLFASLGLTALPFPALPTVPPVAPEPPPVIIPKVGLAIDPLTELVPIDWAALTKKADIASLKTILASYIPNPIYGTGFMSPAQETMDIMMATMNYYMTMMGTWTKDMCFMVIDAIKKIFEDMNLKVPAIPAFTFPTLPVLTDKELFPDFASINNYELDFSPLEKFSLGMTTSSTEICSDYDFAQVCKNYVSAFSVKFVELLVSFWEELKKWAEDVFALPDIFPSATIPIPMIYGTEEVLSE